MKIIAQIVNIECECGGTFLDSRTSSYDITSKHGVRTLRLL